MCMYPNSFNVRAFDTFSSFIIFSSIIFPVLIVYRPENLKYVDKNHNILISKTSVASAKDDEQSAIKALFKTACKTQGMDLSTNMRV